MFAKWSLIINILLYFHYRHPNDSYRVKADWDFLGKVYKNLTKKETLEDDKAKSDNTIENSNSNSNLSSEVTYICNGDVLIKDDIQKIRNATGISNVMIGRGAIDDLSIFSATKWEKDKIIEEYCKLVC